MVCSICRASNRRSLVRLGCGHIFHERCLLRWLLFGLVCPDCRRSIDAVLPIAHNNASGAGRYVIRVKTPNGEFAGFAVTLETTIGSLKRMISRSLRLPTSAIKLVAFVGHNDPSPLDDPSHTLGQCRIEDSSAFLRLDVPHSVWDRRKLSHVGARLLQMTMTPRIRTLRQRHRSGWFDWFGSSNSSGPSVSLECEMRADLSSAVTPSSWEDDAEAALMAQRSFAFKRSGDPVSDWLDALTDCVIVLADDGNCEWEAYARALGVAGGAAALRSECAASLSGNELALQAYLTAVWALLHHQRPLSARECALSWLRLHHSEPLQCHWSTMRDGLPRELLGLHHEYQAQFAAPLIARSRACRKLCNHMRRHAPERFPEVQPLTLTSAARVRCSTAFAWFIQQATPFRAPIFPGQRQRRQLWWLDAHCCQRLQRKYRFGAVEVPAPGETSTVVFRLPDDMKPSECRWVVLQRAHAHVNLVSLPGHGLLLEWHDLIQTPLIEALVKTVGKSPQQGA